MVFPFNWLGKINNKKQYHECYWYSTDSAEIKHRLLSFGKEECLGATVKPQRCVLNLSAKDSKNAHRITQVRHSSQHIHVFFPWCLKTSVKKIHKTSVYQGRCCRHHGPDELWFGLANLFRKMVSKEANQEQDISKNLQICLIHLDLRIQNHNVDLIFRYLHFISLCCLWTVCLLLFEIMNHFSRRMITVIKKCSSLKLYQKQKSKPANP